MSSNQASSFVAEVIRQSLVKRLMADVMSLKPPQVPVAPTGFAGLRAQRDTQRRMRMHQLRTGS